MNNTPVYTPPPGSTTARHTPASPLGHTSLSATVVSQWVQPALTWLGHGWVQPVPLDQHRQHAAQLLDAVLNDTLTPRQALNRWPTPPGVDPSLDVAFTALAHYEADHFDDDKHQQHLDAYYLDAQLAWLQQLYQWLHTGHPIPQALWKPYRQSRHVTGWYTEPTVALGPLRQWIQRFGQLVNSLQTALGLAVGTHRH